MPVEPSNRPQTAKQAKAAFKTRGASYVSEAEKKRLERGAELLRRANRIKAQEAKKKEWQDKQAKDASKQNEVNLSSQRRLDKFGYASSQFHLGKFFKSAPNAIDNVTKNDGREQTEESDDTDPEDETPTSPIDMDMFLDSSTQIAKDLSVDDYQPLPAPPPALSPVKKELNFPSFSSDFDDDTIAELDGVVEELRRSSQSPVKSQSPAAVERCKEPIDSISQHGKNTSLLPPGKTAKASPAAGLPKNATPRAMLPPPRPALAPKPKNDTFTPPAQKTSFQKPMLPPPKPIIPAKRPAAPALISRPRAPASDLSRFGISHADLESLAADDIILSQMPPR
ncbi:hypothetical protein BDZ85DRAFT_259136 [Elsinoe ampelina]|uniref:Uncharacterized protein n=1 Tax=Elsinoe ampelina TaxID=302913 RepID=A0A6A6GGS7_9PEZI|nr:hypothetical protein BDZ85DRAFT_259136 [Elsinoe ampelina]